METENKSLEKQIIYFPASMPDDGADEIDLLEIWNTLWQAKWFISGFTLFCTLVSVALVLFVLPVTYKSNVVLQPMQSGSDGALSKLSGLAGALPIPINLPGQEDKSRYIIDFLNSRTLKARIIENFNLLPRYYPEIWDGEKQEWVAEDPDEIPTLVKFLQDDGLKKIFEVAQDEETGLITVSWVDEDPAFTAAVLNWIAEELNHYLNYEYETDAKRERIFIEGQLEKATRELEYWEEQVPSNDLKLSKIRREELAAQTVYAELRKQLELAKIAEVKEVISFKVLDEPFIPEIDYEPKGAVICGLTLMTSGFFAMLFVFIRRTILNIRAEKPSKEPCSESAEDRRDSSYKSVEA